VLLGVIAIDDLRGIRKLIVGDVPNPNGAISEHDPAWRLAEATARGLPPDALGEEGAFGSCVRHGGTLESRRIGDRPFIADQIRVIADAA
jgi:hypothetical protein